MKKKMISGSLTSMQGSTRFPRPLGTTALSIKYNKERNTTNLHNLYDYVIHQWVLSNCSMNGLYMDINSLSSKTGIPMGYIQCYMKDSILNSKLWNKDKQEELVNGLLGQQLSWALEDRLAINQQIDLLIKSQNGKYRPYISGEVNRALKLKLESSTGLQQVLRNLLGGGTTNIFQLNQQNNNINQEQHLLTIEEARKFLETKHKDTEEAKVLETNYNLQQLPEVIATKQTDVKPEDYGGGSKLNKDELDALTDNYKKTTEEADKEHHEMRREIEESIVPEEIDPENEIEIKGLEEKEDEDPSFAERFLRH